jgi:hypothetical protein
MLASQGHHKGGMAGVVRLYAEGPLARSPAVDAD